MNKAQARELPGGGMERGFCQKLLDQTLLPAEEVYEEITRLSPDDDRPSKS